MKYIPEKVKDIVDEHIKLIEISLPNFLEAYYIYSLVVLGAFNYGKSDVDYLAVVTRKITEADIKILKKIHGDMQKNYHKTILYGMY